MVGPEKSNARSLLTLAIHCRTDPGNTVALPFFPNGSVYQTLGPSRLFTRLELISTFRRTPLNGERGSSNATTTLPFWVGSLHMVPRARSPLLSVSLQAAIGRPVRLGAAGS